MRRPKRQRRALSTGITPLYRPGGRGERRETFVSSPRRGVFESLSRYIYPIVGRSDSLNTNPFRINNLWVRRTLSRTHLATHTDSLQKLYLKVYFIDNVGSILRCSQIHHNVPKILLYRRP